MQALPRRARSTRARIRRSPCMSSCAAARSASPTRTRSRRRAATYLGYLTEMFGQPYVWASAGLTDATHQSERLEGSDCADLMVYGARRMGKRIAYTWTGGLPDVTKYLAAGKRGDDGVY